MNPSLQSQSRPRINRLAAQFSEFNIADENPATNHTNILGTADLFTVLLTTTLADDIPDKVSNGWTRKAENIIVAVEHDV